MRNSFGVKNSKSTIESSSASGYPSVRQHTLIHAMIGFLKNGPHGKTLRTIRNRRTLENRIQAKLSCLKWKSTGTIGMSCAPLTMFVLSFEVAWLTFGNYMKRM